MTRNKKTKRMLTKRPKKKLTWERGGGRPKGSKKRFHFSQTRLGFMLKYEAPFEYYLIMGNKEHYKRHYAPDHKEILVLAKASKNPVFLKDKFNRYLEEYKEYGLYCGRGKYLTRGRVKYYNSMRYKRLYDASKKILPKLKVEGKL